MISEKSYNAAPTLLLALSPGLPRPAWACLAKATRGPLYLFPLVISHVFRSGACGEINFLVEKTSEML